MLPIAKYSYRIARVVAHAEASFCTEFHEVSGSSTLHDWHNWVLLGGTVSWLPKGQLAFDGVMQRNE